MAYQTINENFYQSSVGPLGLQLALQYDNKTGDYRLIEKNLLGIGSAIFYQNGVFYSDAIRDPNLFTNGDPNKITQAGLDLSKNIRTAVNNTYQNLGGLNGGNKINDTARNQNISSSPGVTNAVPGASPGIAGAIPGLSNPSGQGNIFDGGLPDPGPFPRTPNPAATGINSVLKYPKDIIDNHQDTLHITQIEYQPPNEDLFTGDIPSILNEGIKRSSVKKSILGRVILPIPNNPQDSNNVAWGEDNMDAFTTAATATIVQNPGGTGLANLASQIAGSIASSSGLPGLGNIFQNAPPAVLRAALLAQSNQNANVKSALYSYILSKYGFEVSPESILSRGLGVVPNSNLQLLFNNVTLRSFNFSYMMTPRNEEEAKDINMILRFFKQGMAAKRKNLQAGGASLFLGTPNVFKLEYKTSGNKPIAGMNKFKICALTGFGVNYAPSGQWTAYRGGQPSSIVMTMGFRELEPVYDNDYQSTSGDISFDLPSVTSNDIGY